MLEFLATNEMFYDVVRRTAEANGDHWLIWLLMMGTAAGAVVGLFVAPMVVMAIWAERRVSARIQDRVGPNRVGIFGLLQGLADGVKLLGKEYVEPEGAESFFFKLSPALVFAAAYAGFFALPFSHVMVVADFNIAILFILAISSIETLGVLMGGWASNNKWSLLGAVREAIQVVSYEIPLALTVMIGLVMYGSMSLMDIQSQQSGTGILSIFGWGFFRSPFMMIGSLMFYIAGLASCKRTPFDLPEGESELVAGYHTEYPGMGFGMFFFAEYAFMYLICIFTVVLFFGGSHFFGLETIGVDVPLKGITSLLTFGRFVIDASIPLYLSAVVLVAKATIPYIVMIQLRWTLPRYRLDQVIDLCYKVLLPFALVCILGQVVWSMMGLDHWLFDLFSYMNWDISAADVMPRQ